MKLPAIITLLFTLLTLPGFAQDETAFTPDLAEGEQLFKTKCAICHKLDARLIGPPLKGVTERREEEWLIRFIRNSTEVIESGDEYAVALFEEYNQLQMIANPDLSDDQIRNILAYIDPPAAAAAETAAAPETPAATPAAPQATTETAAPAPKASFGEGLSVAAWIAIGLMFFLLLILIYFMAALNAVIRDRKS